MSDLDSTAPVPDSPTPALWEDFIDIFYAPTAVFQRRRGQSGWMVLLIVTIVLAVLFFAWQRALGPVLDIEMERGMAQAMAQNPDLGPEQVERMRSMSRAFGVIGFALIFPIGVVIAAVGTWALARMFGAAATFGTMVLVVSYAQIVRVAGFVVGILQSTIFGVRGADSIHDLGFSLARFLDQPEVSTLAVNMAARVDVFILWSTVLIAIGLHALTNLSRANAWVVAGLLWLLAALPSVGGTLLGGGG